MTPHHSSLIFILLISLASAFAQDSQISPTLSSLFEAERAFAKRCGEVGIRASFTEFFADDGIAFRPHPEKYKAAVKDRPTPPNQLAFELLWEPIFGEVSAAGDMGYDTGPSIFTDKTAEKPTPSYGFFFSVWKKQADGTWKVALDLGTDTKAPYTGSRELQTVRPVSREIVPVKFDTVTARARAFLIAADRALGEVARADGVAKAFSRYLLEESRLHRNGMQPILGKSAICAFLSQKTLKQFCKPIFADLSRSRDLGYTYGSYELKENDAQNSTVEKGYYVRVWKQDKHADWKLVLDVTSPLPPEEKK